MIDTWTAEILCKNCNSQMTVPTDGKQSRFNCSVCGYCNEWFSPTPHQNPPSSAKENDEGGPWADIGAGIAVSLIGLFLIGVTADIHEIFTWIILLLAAPFAGFLFYQGLKGLSAGIVAKFRTRNVTGAKPAPTSAASPSGKIGWRARTHFIVAVLIVAVLNISIPVLDTLPEGPKRIIGATGLLGLTAQCVYSMFRGFRLVFAKGMGASIAMTLAAFYLVSLIPEGLKLIDQDILGGFAPFNSEPENSHFKGVKVKDTSPAELDDLMEDW